MKYIARYPLLVAAIFFSLASGTLYLELKDLLPSGVLTVSVLDVGQGDAIFIETPQGNQILIDSGPSAHVLKQLQSRMSFFDNSIDVVMITHPDKDHIGGFRQIFDRYDIELVLESGVKVSTDIYKKVDSAITQEGSKRIFARRGMDIVLDIDVHLFILFPDRDVSGLDTNDGSIIAKLVYKNTSMMFMGDASDNIETYLVEQDDGLLDSDVLKVGHHGSKTSTSELFVDVVSPDVAVISAGKNNRYGHPHEDILRRFSERDIFVVGTYEEGTLVFESNGKLWVRK